MPPIYV